MDENEKIEALKHEFFKEFKNKYSPEGYKHLGTGAYGFVFRCKDLMRNIDVAVKLYMEGFAPQGSIRGWQLTSLNIHNQIAPTFKIESFKSKALNIDCTAVVQRYVPAKSLKQLYEFFDSVEKEDNFQDVLDDFAFGFVPSLLDVLRFCHSQGFAHGDFHEGNILALPIDIEVHQLFQAILIDFDNSSFDKELKSQSEKEKIASDLRLLLRLYDGGLHQWRYYEQVKTLFTDYKSAMELYTAYQFVIDFIKLIKYKKASKEQIFKLLKKLPLPMLGFNSSSTIKVFKAIATLEKIDVIFNECLAIYIKAITNVGNWEHEVTMIKTEGKTISQYKAFLDKD